MYAHKKSTVRLSKKSRAIPSPLDTFPCVIIFSQFKAGCFYFLKKPYVILGRGSEADIRVEDPTISRSHAAIITQDNKFSVRDLESTNGTYVNYSRVSSKSLQHGDMITLGKTSFKFLFHENILSIIAEEMLFLSIFDGLTKIYTKGTFLKILNNVKEGIYTSELELQKMILSEKFNFCG